MQRQVTSQVTFLAIPQAWPEATCERSIFVLLVYEGSEKTPEASGRRANLRIQYSPGSYVPSAVCCVVVDAAEKKAEHLDYILRAEDRVRGSMGTNTCLEEDPDKRHETSLQSDAKCKIKSTK